MALFESYERRIDQINAALANLISNQSKKLKLSAMKKELMFTKS